MIDLCPKISDKSDQPTILGDWGGHVRAYMGVGRFLVGNARVELESGDGRTAAAYASINTPYYMTKRDNKRCRNPTGFSGG